MTLRQPAPTASLEPPLLAFDVNRRLAAEALGTALLLAIVVGSGVMGERLAGGSTGLALLANALATGAGLVVLITVFGPVSGAHFNPVVTLIFALRGEISPRTALAYVLVQCLGGLVGVLVAHAMFGEAIFQVSAKLREGPAQVFSEAVATFGLVLAILGTLRAKPEAVPASVGLYILSAYWFTASTSFANPAVTLARAASDTFAGIAPSSAPAFIAGQICGAVVAFVFFNWLFAKERRP